MNMKGAQLSRRGSLVGAVAALVLLCGAPGAQADTVTVGSPLTIPFVPTKFGGPGLTVAQTQLPEDGALTTVPVNGRIVSWKVVGAVGGPLTLQVLQPASDVQYTLVAGASGTITGTGLLTFQANLPVKAGDLIGIASQASSDQLGLNSGVQASFYSFWQPTLTPGETRAPAVAGAQGEWAYNAQIDPNCVVPDVKNQKLKQAKQSLKDANCSTGKVKGPKDGKVKSTKPKAGSEGEPHAAVDLKLQKKTKKKK